MPSVKATDLQSGHVLVDPEGHLYEIVGVRQEGADLHMWLWHDNAKAPQHCWTVSIDDEVNCIDGNAGK